MVIYSDVSLKQKKVKFTPRMKLNHNIQHPLCTISILHPFMEQIKMKHLKHKIGELRKLSYL